MLAAIPLTLLFRSAAFPQMVRPPEDKPVGTPLFVVTVKGQEGFIDRDGQIAIEPTYQKAYSFRDGLAAVQKEGEWGFIDTRGRVVIEPQFVMVSSFSEGLAAFRDQRFTDPWGFIDKTGKVVIKPQFDCAEDFRNGIAKVGFQTFQSKLLSRIADVGIQCDERFIDRNGKFLPEPSPLHYATGEPGERIPFLNNGMTGFLNAQGEVVIEPRFQQASAFSDGRACARQGGLYGYIDKRGEWASAHSFGMREAFQKVSRECGLARKAGASSIVMAKWSFPPGSDGCTRNFDTASPESPSRVNSVTSTPRGSGSGNRATRTMQHASAAHGLAR